MCGYKMWHRRAKLEGKERGIREEFTEMPTEMGLT